MMCLSWIIYSTVFDKLIGFFKSDAGKYPAIRIIKPSASFICLSLGHSVQNGDVPKLSHY